jgi:hypothetical protein
MRSLVISVIGGALAATPAAGQTRAAESIPPPLTLVSPKLDPAKAQLARSVAARLLPPGTTREIFRQPLNLTVDALVHSYLMMPVERFVEEHGAELPQEGVNGPPMVRVQLLQILDPASQTRLRVIGPVIQEMAADAAAAKEPQLREALALAYGQRLSVSELQALDRFLATPEGTAFARTSASLENDLIVFAARQAMDRAVADAVPAMIDRLSKATASLPKIRDAADLSEAERKEVAQLLHADPGLLFKK